MQVIQIYNLAIIHGVTGEGLPEYVNPVTAPEEPRAALTEADQERQAVRCLLILKHGRLNKIRQN